MNIKTALNKSLFLLNELFQTKPENVNMKLILNYVTESWSFLYKYLKTIDSKSTHNIDMLIKKVNCEKHMITLYMYEDARDYSNTINVETMSVKTYFNSYSNVIKRLFIYHKDESCCRCQGELFYYFNTEIADIIKECDTCGRIALLQNDHEVKLSNAIDHFELIQRTSIVKIEFEYKATN